MSTIILTGNPIEIRSFSNFTGIIVENNNEDHVTTGPDPGNDGGAGSTHTLGNAVRHSSFCPRSN